MPFVSLQKRKKTMPRMSSQSHATLRLTMPVHATEKLPSVPCLALHRIAMPGIAMTCIAATEPSAGQTEADNQENAPRRGRDLFGMVVSRRRLYARVYARQYANV